MGLIFFDRCGGVLGFQVPSGALREPLRPRAWTGAAAPPLAGRGTYVKKVSFPF